MIDVLFALRHLGVVVVLALVLLVCLCGFAIIASLFRQAVRETLAGIRGRRFLRNCRRMG